MIAGDFKKIKQKSWLNKQKSFHKLIMNDKTSGRSLYTDTQFDQLRFLKMLYRVLETQLLQEPVFAHCGGEGGIKQKCHWRESQLTFWMISWLCLQAVWYSSCIGCLKFRTQRWIFFLPVLPGSVSMIDFSGKNDGREGAGGNKNGQQKAGTIARNINYTRGCHRLNTVT